MRPEIHPEYKRTLITCACGRVSETRSTVEELHVEICSHCHPFFTGRQKLVDTAGRVERYMAKYGDGSARSVAADEADANEASSSPVAAAAVEADEALEVAADAAVEGAEASDAAAEPEAEETESANA